jgi:hypothetical protein
MEGRLGAPPFTPEIPMPAAKKRPKRPKLPKRIRIEIGFEMEREQLLGQQALNDAFRGAVDAVLMEGEFYYAGKMAMRFVRRK